jgi:parallel beta-helix repeat protein
LDKSDRNAIKNNTANDNWHGIVIKDSYRNTITSNKIQRNMMDGINLKHSNDNLIYLNNLVDNAESNALDDGTNGWDNGSRGNYYSGFNCTDVDINGICDSKHNITGGSNVDRYPLASWGQAP